MTVTKDDFEKVWASTSPLTPYSFSDSQYKEGWNFVGSTPPSRQMWDFLQKQNDEKSQYLLSNFDNYLPLSGGTLTGVVNGVTPTAGDDSTKIATTEFVNAKAGNYLQLSGGTMTGEIKGNPVTLTAESGGDSSSLVLGADKSITWDGVSLTDGTFLTTRTVSTPTITSSTSNGIYITAPAVSGYQFVCWYMSTSEGNVYATYIGLSREETCRAWWVGPTPTGTHIDLNALYVRKW